LCMCVYVCVYRVCVLYVFVCVCVGVLCVCIIIINRNKSILRRLRVEMLIRFAGRADVKLDPLTKLKVLSNCLPSCTICNIQMRKPGSQTCTSSEMLE